ncbi:DUF6777 domain-containing protein [Streptomyces sp. NPDC096153]|uniref:DUF6777 domain-containing protein n=1 Tax=Streptomyces sp. NPDC096153 TaxID=3155548 RepID=UPI00331B46EA
MPFWRRSRLTLLSAGTAVVVAMAVILAVSLMGGGSQGGGEIFLQTASAAGRDPFTPSVATDTRGAETPSGPSTSRIGSRTVAVSGAHPGLYGGTQNVASCDVEKQIAYLAENENKGSAFAGALRIPRAEVPAYLRSLTPVRLTWDTRVTNHGYRDGRATEYQAVLQAGTAVLVDDRGVPRVRCACGNPLAPAVAVQGEQTYTGRKWASFRSAAIVAVIPAPKPMKAVTMYDPETKAWFERPNGDVQGRSDHRIPAPKGQPPDASFPVLPEPTESSDLFPEGEEQSEPEGENEDTQDGRTDEDKEKGKDEKKDDEQQQEDEPSRKDEETGKPSDDEQQKDEKKKDEQQKDEKKKDEQQKDEKKKDEQQKDDEQKDDEQKDEKKDDEKKKEEEQKKEQKKEEQQEEKKDDEKKKEEEQKEEPVAPETEQEQQPQQEEDQPVAPEPEQPQPPEPEQPQPPEPEEPAEPRQPEQSEQQLPESPPAEQPQQPDEQEQPQPPAEEQPQQEPQHS